MIHFDPPKSIKSLADVEPGSLVRLGEQGQHLGFCMVSSGDPNLRRSVVTYDQQAHRFYYQHLDSPTVVDYGNTIIVRPDAGSFSPELAAQADGTLYTLEGVPHLVVAVGNAIRFLNLSTGQLQSRQSWPMMGGYRSWIAGVRGLDGRFIEVLSITAAEQDSIEPDEV
jgi:hypothetical protein